MVVITLGDPGLDIGDALQSLTDSVAQLLDQAKATGAARPTAQVDEVMALLTAATYAAQQASWTADLRQRTLAVILRGLK